MEAFRWINKEFAETVLSKFKFVEKSYGNAVSSGVKNAKGKYILIADADDSYDFNDLPKFYDKINEGFDIVQGCRLPGGGGKIEKMRYLYHID